MPQCVLQFPLMNKANMAYVLYPYAYLLTHASTTKGTLIRNLDFYNQEPNALVHSLNN